MFLQEYNFVLNQISVNVPLLLVYYLNDVFCQIHLNVYSALQVAQGQKTVVVMFIRETSV